MTLGSNITFEKINYSKAEDVGTHYYRISERSIKGYKASNDIYIRVVVTSKIVGQDTVYSADIKYFNNNQFSNVVENPTINNLKNVKATISIEKTVDQKVPSKSFSFKLYEGQLNNGTFVKGDSISEKSNSVSDGSIKFSDIDQLTYNDVGTHCYMISENDTDNYVSSGNIYVKVDVEKSSDGKKLETNVSYYSDSMFKNQIKVSDTIKPTINNSSVKLVLKKTDAKETSKTLSGAKFNLKNLTSLNQEERTLAIRNNVTTHPIETDNNGLATFNNLSKGESYLLTEETPPTGYDVAGPWLVTINSDGKIEFKAIKFTDKNKTRYEVVDKTMQNLSVETIDNRPAQIGDKKKEYTLPATGGIGTKKYYLLGTLLSMLGVIYIVMKLGKGGLFGKEDHS